MTLILVAGCAGTVGPVRTSPPHSPAPTVTVVKPGPTKTIVKNARVVRAGHSVPLDAQAGVALRLTVGKPNVSRTRLSSSYGYPPQHGYYVTFRVTVVNTGRRPVDIAPQDFVVRIPGRGTVTSYDGNSPYSGASRQLNTTELRPGERVRAPLTFDVSRVHGRISYVPDETPAVSWTF